MERLLSSPPHLIPHGGEEMDRAFMGTLEVSGAADGMGSMKDMLLGIKRTLVRQVPHLAGSICQL